MTRTRLERLETELHGEPRKHAWVFAYPEPTMYPALNELRICSRPMCHWTWGHGQAEPTGCTRTDPEG